MNKTEKELVKVQLTKEQKTLKELQSHYTEALKMIEEKIIILQSSEQTQSKIYQIQYQEALKGQLEALISNIQSNTYQTIEEYINSEYIDGWVGTFYDLRNQGIPIIAPINQESIVKAVQLNSKLSKPLYESLGINTNKLKKTIRNEISRGLASGQRYQDISRNISNAMNVDLNKAIRITVTEGHRVQNEAKMDALHRAKDEGADIVKQWDATLDGKTRPSHRQVDGEIRELDEKFSNGLLYPGDKKGKAKEVIRCRCVMLERARWALDEEELETLKERAEFYGLDKSKNFEEFKKKFLEVNNRKLQLESNCKYKKIFSNKEEADKYFRAWADKTTYSLGDKKGQYAIYDYTYDSNGFNRPLSGFERSWTNFKGLGKVSLNAENAEDAIHALTKIIENTEPLKQGVILRRGSDTNGLVVLFRNAGFDENDIRKAVKDGSIVNLQKPTILNVAFTSTGIANDAGFNGNISYEIRCPAGTKMVYAEPQSHYGGTVSGRELYTLGMECRYVGSQAEMILQRGMTFRVDKIEPTNGISSYKVYMTVVAQIID